jgi:uncharacterized protein YqgV (UPF0045/DUF77 family)
MWKWFGLVIVTMVAAVPLGCSDDEQDMHQQIFQVVKTKGVTEDKTSTGWTLTGDWEAVIENYGPAARFGTYPNVYRITQTGSTFSAIRTKDDPPLTKEATELGHSPWGRAGSPSVQGELEKNGFKRVEVVDGSGGRVVPTKGQISEDGKKMVLDNGLYIRVTLTRK